jgi:hypothetical protein
MLTPKSSSGEFDTDDLREYMRRYIRDRDASKEREKREREVHDSRETQARLMACFRELVAHRAGG